MINSKEKQSLGLITSYARDKCTYSNGRKTITIGGPGYFTELYLQLATDIDVLNLTPLNFFEVPIIVDETGEHGGATSGLRQKIKSISDIDTFENILINVGA